MTCSHETFQANVQVGRLTDGEDGPVTAWVAEVRVRCAACGLEFGFLGPPAGVRNNEPTTSLDGLELRCPIVPGPVHRFGPQLLEMPERLSGKVRQA
jgi:hypothetical protein